MKIFSSEDKVNFVDINNVFVGFDMDGKCCEVFGYFISNSEETRCNDDEGIKNGLEDYCFDKSYFFLTKPMDVYDSEQDRFKVIVRFKLVAKNKPDLFLHLYNFHNGYYSHGFEFIDNNKIIKEDCI